MISFENFCQEKKTLSLQAFQLLGSWLPSFLASKLPSFQAN